MASTRAPNATIRTKREALDLLETAFRTLAAVSDEHEARVTYLRRFNAKKAHTGEDQIEGRLIIYSRAFDRAEHERSANVVDGLLAFVEAKRREIKGKTAHEKRERREAETKNKNDKGDKGHGNGNK
eukprot:jgi/Tetstr1/446491/TSEL_034019.t1